ncbi:hypothetical protein OG401_02775 [Kitasatospora purpeofusca]|uniref:hypothetical protein n=1 Tax=Kitasatospora purpeofusca TaxID=67352 RepID=UPI0022507753|nr:hypothetical protein [Kitasatospora purpeofusca]MCX4683245.1 hypothetical protein [Kitasatospora purpeofusca]
MCRPDAEASPHGPATRTGAAGRPYRNHRRWTGAAVVVLLLTALGLIGHHTLPAGMTPASHAPAVMAHGTAAHSTAAHDTTAHDTTAHAAPVGAATAPVVTDPVRACAEHRVCSSTVPARGAALAAPPAAALAAPGRPDPAPRPALAHPGLPWPGAPPPDLDVLSVARR